MLPTLWMISLNTVFTAQWIFQALTISYHCDQRTEEADGTSYHFTRLPFGITNGVACFQRAMLKLVQEEELETVYPYLDNITICGMNQKDHEDKLTLFLSAAKRRELVFNDSKCIWSARRLSILGYEVSNGEIRPDPDRLGPLRRLPVPTNRKELQRCVGFFSYYSRWIPRFADRIRPLTKTNTFRLQEKAVEAFQNLKRTVEEAALVSVQKSSPYDLETDASEVAIAAPLNQKGLPVAIFSRTRQKFEQEHPAVEKEAMAITEVVWHWRHYLTCRHFVLKTDRKV